MENWAVGEVSQTLVIDVERFAGNGEGGTSIQAIDRCKVFASEKLGFLWRS